MRHQRFHPLIITSILLVLSILACGLPGRNASEVPTEEIGAEISGITLEVIAEEITPESTPEPELPEGLEKALAWGTVFYEDFSEPGFWPQFSTEEERYILDQETINGEFQVGLSVLQDLEYEWEWIYLPRGDVRGKFTNYYLTVNTTFIEGSGEAAYGLVTHYSLDGCYFFMIRDNSYAFIKYTRDDTSYENIIDWTPNNAILPGATNKLAVVVENSEIMLTINDQVMAEHIMTDLPVGYPAFVADLKKSGESVRIAFDDFSMKSPAVDIVQEASGWNTTFESNFDTEDPNWPLVDDSNDKFIEKSSFDGGKYKIEATAKIDVTWYLAPEMADVSDFYLTVDVENTLGTEYGIIFRQSEQGYYSISISENTFTVWLFFNDQWTALTKPVSILPTNFIDNKVNNIGVIAKGERLIFLANDIIIAEVLDSTYQQGDCGVDVSLYEDGEPSEFMIDNFTVRSPEASTPSTFSTPQEEISPTQQSSSSNSANTNSIDGASMVFVPAGDFLMGSDSPTADADESPEHTVFVDAFWLYQVPVTNSQYLQCLQAGTCVGKISSFPDNNFPAVNVSWDDASTYCSWAGGRLPTEAEWEKGARGTDGRTYPWGNEEPNCLIANYKGCYGGKAVAVGSFPNGASPYGALDMAGLVWEWVADWYDEGFYSYSPASNPFGPTIGEYFHRVQRGGSFEHPIHTIRTTDRSYSAPDNKDYRKGFRCVQDPTP